MTVVLSNCGQRVKPRQELQFLIWSISLTGCSSICSAFGQPRVERGEGREGIGLGFM